jgi:hypothetical protein
LDEEEAPFVLVTVCGFSFCCWIFESSLVVNTADLDEGGEELLTLEDSAPLVEPLEFVVEERIVDDADTPVAGKVFLPDTVLATVTGAAAFADDETLFTVDDAAIVDISFVVSLEDEV